MVAGLLYAMMPAYDGAKRIYILLKNNYTLLIMFRSKENIENNN